mgnify:CR=1 FL=1
MGLAINTFCPITLEAPSSDYSEDGASFLRAAALQAQDFIQPDCGAVSFSGSSKQDRKS